MGQHCSRRKHRRLLWCSGRSGRSKEGYHGLSPRQRTGTTQNCCQVRQQVRKEVRGSRGNRRGEECEREGRMMRTGWREVFPKGMSAQQCKVRWGIWQAMDSSEISDHFQIERLRAHNLHARKRSPRQASCFTRRIGWTTGVPIHECVRRADIVNKVLSGACPPCSDLLERRLHYHGLMWWFKVLIARLAARGLPTYVKKQKLFQSHCLNTSISWFHFLLHIVQSFCEDERFLGQALVIRHLPQRPNDIIERLLKQKIHDRLNSEASSRVFVCRSRESRCETMKSEVHPPIHLINFKIGYHLHHIQGIFNLMRLP